MMGSTFSFTRPSSLILSPIYIMQYTSLFSPLFENAPPHSCTPIHICYFTTHR